MRPRFVKQSAGLFGSAISVGQTRKGTELAPRALREGGLLSALYNLKWQITDHGDIETGLVKGIAHQYERSLIHMINMKAKEIAQENHFMINIGGDHGVATGSISGLKEVYGDDLRILWVDAHADINYSLDPTRNYHGMPVGHLMGLDRQVKGFEWLTTVLQPHQIIYLGLRDVDDQERQIIKEKAITYFSMDDIIEQGIGQIMITIINLLRDKPIHISFDIDSIDPAYAHGTGTLVNAGITDREAHYILRKMYQTGQMVGLDLVEVNPLLELDPENRKVFFGDFQQIGRIQGTQTVALGIELVASALGRTLL